MSRLQHSIRLLLLALAGIPTYAQTAPAARKPKHVEPALIPNLVLLDPAHGGADTGTALGEGSQEKDATMAFAGRIRTALAARGFNVLLTHDSANDQPTPDQRAELANRSRAAACILLHAANGGHGVHLFTSSLTPVSPLSAIFVNNPTVLSWDSAQATSLQQSLGLTFELSDAIHAIRVPLVVGHVSVAPIDSMTCPAVVLEWAPLDNGGNQSSPADPAYQQRIADAVADALTSWRTKLVAQANAANPAPTPAAKPAAPASPPVRKPRPATIPVETPDIIPDAKPASKPAEKTVVPQ